MNDLISVVIPVYNVRPFLDACIMSVVNQSYTNIEIIIVDDGSCDGSEALCDKWRTKDSRIKVIHQTNKGLGAARNVGIENSWGKYILFVDSDDYVDNDEIKILYEVATKYDAGITIGCSKWISEDGVSIVRSKELGTERVISKEDFWKDFCDEPDYIVAWSKLYKRELFDSVRFPVGVINEDFSITRHLIDITDKIAYSGQYVYYYRMRQGSITRKSFSEKNLYLIGERLRFLDYILTQRYSEETKYYICRRQFTEGIEGIANGLKYLNNENSKKTLKDYYEGYKPIARLLMSGMDGKVVTDFYTRLIMRIYLHGMNCFFRIRGLKKEIVR